MQRHSLDSRTQPKLSVWRRPTINSPLLILAASLCIFFQFCSAWPRLASSTAAMPAFISFLLMFSICAGVCFAAIWQKAAKAIVIPCLIVSAMINLLASRGALADAALPDWTSPGFAVILKLALFTVIPSAVLFWFRVTPLTPVWQIRGDLAVVAMMLGVGILTMICLSLL